MNYFNFTEFPNFKTERLKIRQANFDDIESVFELRSCEEINKFVETKRVQNFEETKDFISLCNDLFENKNRIFWLIELENIVIGSIVLHKISLENKYAEIGYKLKPEFYRKGIMSEVVDEVLKFGFKEMNLNTIEAYTHKNNIPSIALLKKYNFIYLPEKRDEKIKNNRIFKLEKNNFESHK
jgi:ribosomal-protein-alanine N-acetyltransferase